MSNDAMRTTWANDAPGWVENERLYDALFAPVTDAIVSAAQWSPGQTALDVGCGSGTLLARGASAGLDMVGIDISDAMAAAARARVPNARVEVADAQSADLRQFTSTPYAHLVSRFGVMFFEDPTAAFANLRAASAPGAQVSFACWRGSDENPIFTLGVSVLVERMTEVTGPPPERKKHAPGPTAFGNPDRVNQVLAESGWNEIAIEPFDFALDHGFDGTDGVDNRMRMILGTSTGSAAQRALRPELGDDGWNTLLDDVRDVVQREMTDGTLRIPGATWLVTARA